VPASGKPLEILGLINFTVNINGLIVPIYARVARYVTHDLILGTDFLRENGVIIDYNLGLVSLNEDLVRVPLQTEFKQRNLVTNVEAVCLTADAEALINVKCPRYFEGKTVLLEQFLACNLLFVRQRDRLDAVLMVKLFVESLTLTRFQ